MRTSIWFILILIFILGIEFGLLDSDDGPKFCNKNYLKLNKTLLMTALNANNTYYVFRDVSFRNNNSKKEVLFKWDSMLQPSKAGKKFYGNQ